jgi:uncharacterized protein YecE (DUF72 family)
MLLHLCHAARHFGHLAQDIGSGELCALVRGDATGFRFQRQRAALYHAYSAVARRGDTSRQFFRVGRRESARKLEPFLWELPPSLKYDPALLEAFLSPLPRDTDYAAALARRHDAKVKGRAQPEYGPKRMLRHAIEVRHESFVDPAFIEQLRTRRVAFVIADTAGKWPEYEDVTADFVYIRLHGADELYVSGYSDKMLDRWSERIRLWSAGREPRDARRIAKRPARRASLRDVFCYFDNTAKEHAPRNARRLMMKLGLRRPGR